MKRLIACFGFLLLLVASSASASGLERLQYGDTMFRRSWDGENANEYQPDGDGARGNWRRLIVIGALPDVHDMAGLRAAIAKYVKSYADRGTVLPQICLPGQAGRPAECRTVVRVAVQAGPDGMFVVTAVERFVLDRGRAVHAMIGWRSYGMDALARNRAFVNSPAGRDAIQQALGWPVPVDAAPRAKSPRERAAANAALRKLLHD